MLVFDDADLDRAVDGRALGRRSRTAARSAPGVERIYVARPLYEPFVEELVAARRALRIGAGADPRSSSGRSISEDARDKVE